MCGAAKFANQLFEIINRLSWKTQKPLRREGVGFSPDGSLPYIPTGRVD
jgi:hypothetical protein